MELEIHRPKLLVSVRSADEAEAAIVGGADLIDVKEPLRGSLGAADDRTLREVAEAVGRQKPLSAALGELHDWRRAQVPPSLALYGFAKLGLSQCRTTDQWQSHWKAALDSMPHQTKRVAVAYADWLPAEAPSPEHVLQCASQFNCAAVLLDTYHKNDGTLFDHFSLAKIRQWIAAVKQFEMLCVIAGSLSECLVEKLMPLGPDIVAVRGAVCGGGRAAAVDANLVSKLSNLIRGDCRKPTVFA